MKTIFGISKLGLKVISVITLGALGLQETAWASGTPFGAVSSVVDETSSGSWGTGAEFLKTVSLPHSLGEIQKVFIGTSPEVVIHVQDAHANYEAQKNIATILNYFVIRHGLDLVNVEGTPQGRIQTEILSSFPDAKIRKTVSDHLLKQAKISGPEFLSLTGLRPFSLHGIEDETLYEANRKAFARALTQAPKNKLLLEGLRGVLEELSRRMFSKDLLRFLELKKEAVSDPKLVIERARFALETADRLGISPKRYPALQAFRDLEKLESETDLTAADKDVALLERDLRMRLRTAELAFFMTQSVQFRLGKISQGEFFTCLSRSALQHGFSANTHPQAFRYFNIAQLRQKISIDIFHELDGLERTLKGKLYRNDLEKDLDQAIEYTGILGRLFDLSWTKEDATAFYRDRATFSAEAFRGLIKNISSKQNIRLTRSLPTGFAALDKDTDATQAFYELAIRRDQALLSNALENARASGSSVAALVTGGFHTPGIEKELESRGISYMVVTPRIDTLGDEVKQKDLYRDSVLRRPSPLERFVSDHYAPISPSQFRNPRSQLAARSLLQLSGIEPGAPVTEEVKRNYYFVASTAALLKTLGILNGTAAESLDRSWTEALRRAVGAAQGPGYSAEDLLAEIMGLVIPGTAPILKRESSGQTVFLIPGREFGDTSSSLLFAVSSGKISRKIEDGLRLPVSDLIEKNLFQVPGGKSAKGTVQVNSYTISPETLKAISEESSLAGSLSLPTVPGDMIRHKGPYRSPSAPLPDLKKPEEASRILTAAFSQEIGRVKQEFAGTDRVSVAVRDLAKNFHDYKHARDFKVTESWVQDKGVKVRYGLDYAMQALYAASQSPEEYSVYQNELFAALLSRLTEAKGVTALEVLRSQTIQPAKVKAASLGRPAVEKAVKPAPVKTEPVVSRPAVSLSAAEKPVFIISATLASFFLGFLFAGIPGAVFAPFLFRFSWVLSALLNEWAHLGMASLLGYSASYLRPQNFLGNIKVQDWMERLNPFVWRFTQDPSARKSADLESQLGTGKDRMIRQSGWIVSAAFWIGLSALSVIYPPLAVAALGAFFAFADSSITDLLEAEVCGVYGCGNAVVYRLRRDTLDGELIEPETNLIMEKMGFITRIRGEQAAGRTAFFGGSGSKEDDGEGRSSFSGIVRPHRNRLVNEKRDDLPIESRKTFESGLWWKRWWNWDMKPLEVGRERIADFVMEHYRFGTSSAPAESETHPHVWVPGRDVMVWKVKNGKLVQEKLFLENHVSHNGDFDKWQIFEEDQSNGDMGLWLEHVLDTPNDTLGDSPKAAGMIDLLFTQGMWDASVRLAYQLAIARSLKDAFGGQPLPKFEDNMTVDEWIRLKRSISSTAPSKAVIAEWASVFENIFRTAFARVTFPVGSRALSDLPAARPQLFEALVSLLLQEVKNRPAFQGWLPQRSDPRYEEKIRNFVRLSVKVFAENDLFTTTQRFIQRAEGTFGLVVASTLKPDGPVLVSKGNPLAIGMSDDGHTLAFVSEPAALKIDDFKYFQNRYTMDLMNGEVANISVKEDGYTITLYDLNSRQVRDAADVFPTSPRYVRLVDNPLITPLPKEDRKDPVGSDLKDLPKVERSIMDDWADPNSYNRQTLQDWVKFLAEAHERRKRVLENISTRDEIEMTDVLIVGIGDSIRIPEHYAHAAHEMYPNLAIGRTSSNKVLAALDNLARSGVTTFPDTIPIKDATSTYHIGKKTMILFVTQSGQTFPTTLSISKLQEFTQDSADPTHRGRVFIMTGEMDTPAGEAVGQIYRSNHKPGTQGAPFSKRIFVNGSGRRPSEASTVATGATHSTFAQLFIRSGLELKNLFPDQDPLGMFLSPADLEELLRYQDKNLLKTIPAIVGWDEDGKESGAALHKQLVQLGRRYAKDVLESPKVWGLAAFYILVSVATGYSLFAGLGHLLAWFSVWTGISSGAWLGSTSVAALFKAGDILFYIFLAPLLTYALRFLERRTILDRVYGTRVFVYGDTPVNHLVANGFVTRLMSMAYGIATLIFKTGNPQDHFVHDLAHQVVRGTRVILGVPETGAKSAVEMTGSQTRGIQNLPFRRLLEKFGFKSVGAEVVTLGHSANIKKSSTDRHIVVPLPRMELNSTEGLSGALLERTKKRNALMMKLGEMFFNSHNRLRSVWVIFYEAAKRISNFWPLRFDMSRTQSGTRVATTASPVSGAAITGLRRPDADEFSEARPTILNIRQSLPRGMKPAEALPETAATAPRAAAPATVPPRISQRSAPQPPDASAPAISLAVIPAPLPPPAPRVPTVDPAHGNGNGKHGAPAVTASVPQEDYFDEIMGDINALSEEYHRKSDEIKDATRGASLGKDAKDGEAERIVRALEAIEHFETISKKSAPAYDLIDQAFFPSAQTAQRAFLVIEAPKFIDRTELASREFISFLEKTATHEAGGANVIVAGIGNDQDLTKVRALLSPGYGTRIRFVHSPAVEVARTLSIQVAGSQGTVAVIHAEGTGAFAGLGENILDIRYDAKDSMMSRLAVKRFALRLAGKIALYGEEGLEALRRDERLALSFDGPRTLRMDRSSLLYLLTEILSSLELSRRAVEKAA